MKLYKSPDGVITGYADDGSQDYLIPSDYIELTPSEKQQFENNNNKNICKQQASQLLYETDWTTIPDVANPANTPYLTNQAEFIAWRSQIRALAVNPVANPVFPPKPDEVWG